MLCECSIGTIPILCPRYGRHIHRSTTTDTRFETATDPEGTPLKSRLLAREALRFNRCHSCPAPVCERTRPLQAEQMPCRERGNSGNLSQPSCVSQLAMIDSFQSLARDRWKRSRIAATPMSQCATGARCRRLRRWAVGRESKRGPIPQTLNLPRPLGAVHYLRPAPVRSALSAGANSQAARRRDCSVSLGIRNKKVGKPAVSRPTCADGSSSRGCSDFILLACRNEGFSPTRKRPFHAERGMQSSIVALEAVHRRGAA